MGKIKCVSILIVLSFFLLIFGRQVNVVKFTDLYSHMEVSLEKKGYLIFRALLVPKSYVVVIDYNFYVKKHDKGNQYFLTLFEKTGNKKPKTGIEYTKEGGIKVTIPIQNFNSGSDSVFYKDKNGVYKIAVGNKSNWLEYLKKIDLRK